MKFYILGLVATFTISSVQGQCQEPGNAKCFSASAPIGPVGSRCCPGAQCQPWLEPGKIFTVPVDWYCQSIQPFGLNEACDNKRGKCATGLNCIAGFCSNQAIPATTPAITTPAITTPAITTPGEPLILLLANCPENGQNLNNPVGLTYSVLYGIANYQLCGYKCQSQSPPFGLCMGWSYTQTAPNANNCYLKTQAVPANLSPDINFVSGDHMCPPRNPANCPGAGVNILGGTMAEIYNVPTWQACGRLCTQQSPPNQGTCLAWSYIPTVIPAIPNERRCYLKTLPLAAGGPNPNFISGDNTCL